MKVTAAAPVLAPRTTEPAAAPKPPTSPTPSLWPVDSFEGAAEFAASAARPHPTDASMRAALRQLPGQGRVSGAELMRAFETGMADRDGKGAAAEFFTARDWVSSNLSRLSPEARAVYGCYAKTAGAARADGRTGLTGGEVAHLKTAMAAAAKAAPAAKGRIDTTDKADKFFLTQWGRNKWNAASAGKYGYSDCAPTSGVMALAALGVLPPPTRDTASTMIDHLRDQTRGHNTNQSSATKAEWLVKGLNANPGVKAKLEPANLANLDAALAQGKKACIGGNPWNSWGRGLHAKGQYLNSRDPGNHEVAVLGKTADGHYLLADPLSRTGTIEVSGAQIKQFWTGYHTLVVVGRK